MNQVQLGQESWMMAFKFLASAVENNLARHETSMAHTSCVLQIRPTVIDLETSAVDSAIAS